MTSVRKDLENLLMTTTSVESPFLNNAFDDRRFWDTYELVKFFIKQKPWYLPRFFHRKLVEYLIGTELISKRFWHQWKTEDLK